MNARLTMSGSLLVGVASLAGLAALINLEQPSKWLIGLGLLLVVLAMLGFTAPVWRLIMKKVSPKSSSSEVTVMGLRLGLWSGIFVASVILLRILNFMDRVLILAVLALLIMIEMFLQQNAAKKRAARRGRR
jgi:hypothetical protein